MALTNADIVLRPGTPSSTPAQNGGRMAYSLISDAVKNNLFPDVGQDDRVAGLETFRKAFFHLNSTSDSPLISPKIYLSALTPADDFVTFIPGTATDTEDAISGRHYGVGTVTTSLSIGASSFNVAGESNDYATLEPFKTGDKLYIAGTNPDWLTIDTVSYVDNIASITTTSATLYAHDINAIAATVYEPGDIEGAVSNLTVTSAAGTFLTTQATVQNKGGIADSWTITFTSATAFTCAGTVTGSVTSGNINSDFKPTNPSTSSPYFTLKTAGWGGTYVAGDTVTFDTAPASVGLWLKRKVPAGTTTLANNAITLSLIGESA